ncbi:MAG: type 4a pilus biogenesis protein PilO [Deltaproteobacteria bacterium]|nr:type 4a pilus biogenesis protein PilO [Deltaproteobacteria bacterium]
MAITISELGERFSKLSNVQKYGAFALVLALFGAVFYFMFYSELSDKADRYRKQARAHEVEKAGYEEKKQKYMAFRAEVNKLLQEQKEREKELPTRAEIASFLQSLNAQAELAGLKISDMRKRPEQRRGFYATIPVHMVIRGTYHQIAKFFHSIGMLKRIVNVRDLLLKGYGGKGTADKAVLLQAKFVASTFRFVKKAAPRKKKKGRRR